MAELTAKQHRAGATIPASKGYPAGRFPMNDPEHARLALQMLPRAKNMSAQESAAVRARATRMLAAGRAAKGK